MTTLSSVIAKYKAIYLALNDIAVESSSPDARTTALSHLKLLQSSNFIVSLIVAQFILSFSHPLCLSLQKTNCDIIKAYHNAKLCQTTISKQRNEAKFSELWKKAKVIADEIDVELTKPRTTTVSRFRSNAGVDTTDADSAELHYRRNVYYPFIDHCIKEFSEQFPESSLSRFYGYNLHPGKVSQITSTEVTEIANFHGNDLPCIETFEAEVTMWKEKFIADDISLLEKMKLIDVLPLADKDFFPNIHEVLKQILTVPVGSVPCERSFSSMRRLKDWSRSTMTEERLNGLALMYIHQDKSIDKDSVLKRFDCTGQRRITFN